MFRLPMRVRAAERGFTRRRQIEFGRCQNLRGVSFDIECVLYRMCSKAAVRRSGAPESHT